MLRMVLYPFYLFAPYVVVYRALFEPHFHFQRFLYFSVLLIAARSMAADAKDLVGAAGIKDELAKLDVEFKRLNIGTRLLKGGARNAALRLTEISKSNPRPSLFVWSFLPILMLLKATERTLVLAVSKIKGNYFTTYTCLANRWLSVILVPDDPEVVASDPQRKFALLHELGHCSPNNLKIFEREKSETQIFSFIIFLVILSYETDPFWKWILVLVPIFFLSLHLNSRLLDFGRLGAEIHADNIATKLAYLLDRPLFRALETIQLPNDRMLDPKQEKLRRSRFRSTLVTYRLTGMIDTRADETLPPISFYFWYAVLVYVVGRTISWGDAFTDKTFEPWWFMVGGALALKVGSYFYSRKIKRLVMTMVTGDSEELLFDVEQEAHFSSPLGDRTAPMEQERLPPSATVSGPRPDIVA